MDRAGSMASPVEVSPNSPEPLLMNLLRSPRVSCFFTSALSVVIAVFSLSPLNAVSNLGTGSHLKNPMANESKSGNSSKTDAAAVLPLQILVAEGEVWIRGLAKSELKRARPGDTIRPGERLLTSRKSSARIVFWGGESLELSERSEILITDYAVRKPNGPTATRVQLLSGRLQAEVGPISKYFEIRTPSASILTATSEIIATYDNLNRRTQLVVAKGQASIGPLSYEPDSKVQRTPVSHGRWTEVIQPMPSPLKLQKMSAAQLRTLRSQNLSKLAGVEVETKLKEIRKSVKVVLNSNSDTDAWARWKAPTVSRSQDMSGYVASPTQLPRSPDEMEEAGDAMPTAELRPSSARPRREPASQASPEKHGP